jgi:hypothetical protein
MKFQVVAISLMVLWTLSCAMNVNKSGMKLIEQVAQKRGQYGGYQNHYGGYPMQRYPGQMARYPYGQMGPQQRYPGGQQYGGRGYGQYPYYTTTTLGFPMNLFTTATTQPPYYRNRYNYYTMTPATTTVGFPMNLFGRKK